MSILRTIVHHRRGGRGLRRAVLAAAGLLLWAKQPTGAGEPAYSFRNPFHPEQCERAIQFGDRLLARDASSQRGRLLVAEGLLCKGLDDDPWALDAAITALREIVADAPANFFAQLELADASRKRFPLSADAESTLSVARRQLDQADVGAGRVSLAAYIDENLAAIAEDGTVALGVLRFASAVCYASNATTAETVGVVSRLAQTGPPGLSRAQQCAQAYLVLHPDDAVVALSRAELLRGRIPRADSMALYADAEAHLCNSAWGESPECSLARWRLKQLGSRDQGSKRLTTLAAAEK